MDDPRAQRLHDGRRGKGSWAKGTKGLVKSWSKGLTKETDARIAAYASHVHDGGWHEAMKNILTKGTDIEILLQEELNKAEIQFLANPLVEHIFHPDLVLAGSKVIIFADGCYWHGCSMCYPMPKTHQVKRAIADERITRVLVQKGWQVYRFKGCQITADAAGCISGVVAALQRTSEKAVEVYTYLPDT